MNTNTIVKNSLINGLKEAAEAIRTKIDSDSQMTVLDFAGNINSINVSWDTPTSSVSQIFPYQEGEGIPSLTNVRNILGYETISSRQDGEIIRVTFPEVVYRGAYDWKAKVLTITHKFFELAVSDMNNIEEYPGWKKIPDINKCFPVGTAISLKNSYYNISNRVLDFRVSSTEEGSSTLYTSDKDFGLTQSQWKEQYPDLICQFLFPLLEPRIIEL